MSFCPFCNSDRIEFKKDTGSSVNGGATQGYTQQGRRNVGSSFSPPTPKMIGRCFDCGRTWLADNAYSSFMAQDSQPTGGQEEFARNYMNHGTPQQPQFRQSTGFKQGFGASNFGKARQTQPPRGPQSPKFTISNSLAIKIVVISAVFILACSLLEVAIQKSRSEHKADGVVVETQAPNPNSVWAYSYTPLKDFEYSFDNDEIYIKKYTGRDKKVYIGSEYEIDGVSRRVVSLDDTFYNKSVTSVIIGDGVRWISDDALNSNDLEFVYMPASVEQFDGWLRIKGLKKLYYGGSDTAFHFICTADRSRMKIKQVVYNSYVDGLEVGSNNAGSSFVESDTSGYIEDDNSVWATSYINLGDFEYYIDGTEITLTKYNGIRKKVHIAPSYNVDGIEMKVTAIDNKTFGREVSSLILPESLVTINSGYGSARIEYLYVPASLKDAKDFIGDRSYLKELYYGGTQEQLSALIDISRYKNTKITCQAVVDGFSVNADNGVDATYVPEPTWSDLSAEERLLSKGLPERYVASLLVAFADTRIDPMKSSFSIKKIEDWASGERYEMDYGTFLHDYYTIYFNADNTVASIRQLNIKTGNLELIWDAKDHSGQTPAQADQGVDYTIKYGELGDFGKIDLYDGEEYIRYYLPAGDYTVVSPGGVMSGFYIEKTAIYKDGGWDNSDVVRDCTRMEANTPYDITVKSDECLSLVVGTTLYVTAKG